MSLIHRVIPEKHVQSIIDGQLYFVPCKTFVDLLEFRFAYCRDSYEIAQIEGKPEIFDGCIRRTFSNEKVQERIDGTSISCWTYQSERPFMWEVYAHSEPAIILTLDEHEFEIYVKEQKRDLVAAGRVRYQFAPPSMTHPEFLVVARDPDWNKDFDLFFHKHGFYGFEREFRAAIFEPGPVNLPLQDQMVKSITLSPLALLNPDLLKALREQFRDRVRESQIRWPR
jgi:hypothetical protein